VGDRPSGTVTIEEGFGMATTAATTMIHAAIDREQLTAAGRGWGQGINVGGRWTWPTGSGTRGSSFRDSLCDQLRHNVAWHPRSSHEIAVEVGITPAVMDRFMQGDDDALSFATAANVARVVSCRLIDQRIVEGMLDEIGTVAFTVATRNPLRARATRRRSTV